MDAPTAALVDAAAFLAAMTRGEIDNALAIWQRAEDQTGLVITLGELFARHLTGDHTDEDSEDYSHYAEYFLEGLAAHVAYHAQLDWPPA